MYLIILFTYILILTINLCIKNIRDMQKLENARLIQEEHKKDIILKTRDKTPEKKRQRTVKIPSIIQEDVPFQKYHEFDEEPGRDFIRDEHGNVIYGFGYTGAPLIPWSQFGLSPVEFIKFYKSVNKLERQNFIKDYTTQTDEMKYIIKLLKTFESSEFSEFSESFKNEDQLLQELNKLAKECAPRAYHPQLKYLKEIKDDMINISHQKKWRQEFQKVLTSITSDETKLTTRCFYCNHNVVDFQTECCKLQKKYICKSCLQQNYFFFDFNHPIYCRFCRNFPYIQLIR
jgi:hypothetical protein